MVATPDSGGRNRSTVPAALLLCLTLGLAAFGLVVLTSAGKSFKASDPHFIFRRQAVWLPLALAAGMVAAFIDLDWVRRYVRKFYAAAILCLITARADRASAAW